ncbi:MAG: SDR family NAD(P)-dependent oxidoreductase, partial [Anaerolineales bacterium]|nr:SDR family NAD(P)-dependent oxidoreductase [Anaerolineales bacterium]
MKFEHTNKLYDISGKTAVVTGGAGVLCAAMCRALNSAGANIAVLDLNLEAAEKLAADLQEQNPGAIAVACNVLERSSVETAAGQVLEHFGQVDILINGAGGNQSRATTNAEQSFFDLPTDALRWVFDLNLLGTILPSQVFGKIMAEQKTGVILNISSMNAFRPLTRIAAYSAAKAGVSNFTQWLAVHMAQEYSSEIRVNALAPGFFLTEQNRFLLTDKETGELTERGQSIINHTPQGHFGTP